MTEEAEHTPEDTEPRRHFPAVSILVISGIALLLLGAPALYFMATKPGPSPAEDRVPVSAMPPAPDLSSPSGEAALPRDAEILPSRFVPGMPVHDPDEAIPVRFADAAYTVPAEYFDDAPDMSEEQSTTLSIDVMYPEMAPAGIYADRILKQEGSFRIGLNMRETTKRENVAALIRFNLTYLGALEDRDAAPVDGYRLYAAPDDAEVSRGVLFLPENPDMSGHIDRSITFFLCPPAHNSDEPCSMYYERNNKLYQIELPQTVLSRWVEIQGASNAFLDSLRQDPAFSSPKTEKLVESEAKE